MQENSEIPEKDLSVNEIDFDALMEGRRNMKAAKREQQSQEKVKKLGNDLNKKAR